MSSVPLDSPAERGLFGALRSWLRARSSEIRGPVDVAPQAAAGLDTRSDAAVCVLVVDDNPVNLMTMSAMIQSRGLTVVVAGDGAEAAALACEMHFDLILMDLQMPVLDGFGATLAIRRFERSNSRPSVPVIAYSSGLPNEAVLTRHGINGSLCKPCAHQELEDCLMKWCPTYRSAPSAPDAPYHLGLLQPAAGHRGSSIPQR